MTFDDVLNIMKNEINGKNGKNEMKIKMKDEMKKETNSEMKKETKIICLKIKCDVNDK